MGEFFLRPNICLIRHFSKLTSFDILLLERGKADRPLVRDGLMKELWKRVKYEKGRFRWFIIFGHFAINTFFSVIVNLLDVLRLVNSSLGTKRS